MTKQMKLKDAHDLADKAADEIIISMRGQKKEKILFPKESDVWVDDSFSLGD